MKSALRQKMEADLISSEAERRRFHTSLLGFHRGNATISLTMLKFCGIMVTNGGDLMNKNTALDSIEGRKVRRQHFSYIIACICLIVIPMLIISTLLGLYGEIPLRGVIGAALAHPKP